MKPLVLSSTSIFLSLKNELKIFLHMETYEKGGPPLEWSLLEHTSYLRRLLTRLLVTSSRYFTRSLINDHIGHT